MSNLWKWKPRRLRWGETPWDDMPRDQLVREVQRMYAALIAARGPLHNGQRNDPTHPYWQRGGTGGDATTMVEQALSPYSGESCGNSFEPAYEVFFRYANDLLFDGCGSNWMVCEKGDLIGSYDGKWSEACPTCVGAKRGIAAVRPITWDDLKPRRKAVSK